ncbi:MAG: protein-ADP-ribose hydrolase [Clostridiales bacterium]|jgi:O-acetyl-ADP-ribose deacetylase (regulator of RNase III)|nr:protein-ADP-ribose hydrolase [Clostridiales bacterium]
MTQNDRLDYLIGALLAERGGPVPLPADIPEKQRLLRTLFNIRPPLPVKEEVLRIQDEYLTEEIRRRGITDADTLTPADGALYLWRGDITTLRADVIVNAANSRLLGCFVPGHHCVDNAIHTFAGMQLRLACAEIMSRQGREEPTGQAKLTPAFNLPSRCIAHTVGPIVTSQPTREDKERLASCYRACLSAAEEAGASSIAFCCLSTGEFCFPQREAAAIAVETVRRCLAQTNHEIKVIFNVFQDTDESLYRQLLSSG